MTPPTIQFPVARFTSLLVESVLAFLCFAMTLHYACQSNALLAFALPRHLAIETLLASLVFVAVWMMLFFDLRQQQLHRMSLNDTFRATLFGLTILTPVAVVLFKAFHANWSITTIVARFWLWSLSLTIAVTIFNFTLRRMFMDS